MQRATDAMHHAPMQHAAQVGDLECLTELVAHRRAADVRAAHICTRTGLTPA